MLRNNMRASIKKKIIILSAGLFLAILLGVTKGSVNLPLTELFSPQNRGILFLRLSRVLLAIITGSGLAVSGIALQATLRNPLAEPYILGTSSGAGLGAVIAIMLGLTPIFMPVSAFIGAGLAMLLVYNLARQGNKIPVQSLVLSGVIVSIALSGILVFMVSVSSNEALHGLMWWLWGSLQVYDLKLLLVVGIITLTGIIAIFMLSQDLNAISIGEEEAIHLGINAEAVKKILFFITSLITAGLVSVCGVIGFVGLIIPHIMRLAIGPNHKFLIPASCLGGAIFMIICDLISRTAIPTMEIPIGVITAIIGAPVFLILLKRKQRVN
ncbi:MAG: iron ABC transporter permease [Candidatus Omnitrophica bacterium]|nr:iron ABC transporter permease [Candidatus Omnitrophota bacterium]